MDRGGVRDKGGVKVKDKGGFRDKGGSHPGPPPSVGPTPVHPRPTLNARPPLSTARRHLFFTRATKSNRSDPLYVVTEVVVSTSSLLSFLVGN